MFSRKLIKLYIFRLIGILTAILSYTIVIPKLSSNVQAYGIYTVVVSLLLLLQYADLGFLGAGQKYAAEAFARDDRKEEIEILSFVHFILFVVVILYSLSLIYVYFNPHLVFNNISEIDIQLAKHLILIFIAASPLIVMQRFISAVFSIRIEDYILQFVEITSSIIKILSTFFFFKNDNYNIVGYILFMQCMNLLSVMIELVIIKFRYKYNFRLVAKTFRFSKKTFELTKKMAITSIALTISWILYYELDSVYVSKLYNPKTVALFAIGITMLTFSRSLMNAFFSPFQTKFNHLRGIKDENSLSAFFIRIVVLSFPISIISPICIIILMKPLIISWIGFNYFDSILISKILIANLFFSFLLIPISYLAMAREKFKFLLISSLMLPFFYLLTYLLLYKYFGLLSLPMAKVITLLINLIINVILIKEVINFSLLNLLFSIGRQIIFPVLLLLLLLYITSPLWNIATGKNTFHFLRIVGVGSICTILSILLYYFINPDTRLLLYKILAKFKPNAI